MSYENFGQYVPKNVPAMFAMSMIILFLHTYIVYPTGFATFLLFVLNLCSVNDVSVHKLNYH